MSLPPGFLDELRTRTSLAQVVGRKVMWDARKSNQGKGDMWAPCPFHQEKSASFHVDDRKGFYYCFGCHAKGDAISFIRETENVGFREAIEMLAREAGMTLPERDPQERQRADQRSELADVMEAAVRFYRMQLSTGAATEARAYLERRGLGSEALSRFDIGFAPDQRRILFQHLTGQGIAADKIIDAGLAAIPDGGGSPYDRFRGRIIYPIRNGSDRCIALGGRAMATDARAKYLNSPETELFDKGRTLYNLGPARKAVGQGATLIVAEGYMDVIALVEAGFGGAVAPLGTAVTADQLALMWRLSPEPVIALDGDKAGLNAARRIIDLALPLLEAGRSLRFCLLPKDLDPDDLIRKQGAGAMQAALDRALPLVQLLWQREIEGVTFDSPERRAALEKSLRDKTALIQDPSLRHHYVEELRRLQWELFHPRRKPTKPFGKPGDRTASASASASARGSLLAADASAAMADELREAVILATILATPKVLDQFADSLSDLTVSTPLHRETLTALIRWHMDGDGTARSAVAGQIGATALENLLAQTHVALTPAVRNPGDLVLARQTVREELAKLASRRGLAEEVAENAEDFTGFSDDGVAMKWRLAQATEARVRADRQTSDEGTSFETGPNGAKLNRDERSKFDQLIREINFTKSRGGSS